ncbi:cyclohexanecarboxylate-CoA ligase [Cupriavidus taiwanensis]|uniref:Cyclohexanecarboxylate-CoA ligase n=1 Tax=Cupriavidus taiwanensis TaxID=164546 RepID=A0A7Z7JCM4_9BURK|nr:cyclohexanecarboxylate-CoA ligase [Cupriavidus taiwanensis]SOZ08231.1 Cyclohexanecarboxylate-CoA ligase [Cupriavidus taiwanensis]SOZ13022.1 Cyclohexanecarboxylate-CoA ligase [Cupriavidus taiwanensis]SOZ41525.1 Cyclohexanecarboxylate-CoA ligase [Cupriavidus taiwanensis]SPC20931.1 Cyclohexanecarboxylate-CoA ligase [Cupriavidus taiwanensis]SPD55073.1 Cyclohexanecarboxylate-CoA ligase [Cupriavidus taiwanensis]
MDFDAVLIAPRRAASIAAGHWQDRTIHDYLAACVRDRPDAPALTALSIDRQHVTRFTWRELARMADRVAVGLSRLGIAAGDVVSCQLPNGWHLSVLYLACARLGAVLNPVMPIFRERELSFMLAHAQSKVVVVPKLFRGFDHSQMLRGLRDALPALRHVVVVDGDGDDSFEALLSGPHWEDGADAAAILLRSRSGPDDVTQLIYTSGTTGEPKGVMHTANTLFSNIVAYAGRLHLGGDDVVLMASPMAHQTGFMYGLMMPVVLGAHAVLQDIWDPVRAAALIRDEGVTFTMGSTPFLTDLARVVAESGVPVPSLRIFLCAGAPIPGALVEQARQALGAKIVSAWGMTENGAVTTTLPEDSDERASTTDGCPLPGVAIRVVDGTDTDVPVGETGRLLVRACSNFGGYLKRPQLNGTDADGWFDTGDLARLDADGYLRIAGRSKDVIIRGGENIPVLEIETLLYRHPAVAQVAIVAYPDARLGERACAFVVPRAGQSIDLDGMVDWLKQQKMALQYIPEKLVVRDALPATPAGKIQKFRLREMLVGDAGFI